MTLNYVLKAADAMQPFRGEQWRIFINDKGENCKKVPVSIYRNLEVIFKQQATGVNPVFQHQPIRKFFKPWGGKLQS